MWRLMGPPQNSDQYNMPSQINQINQNFDEQITADFTVDNTFEIQKLRQRVEQLAVEVDMITNSQQDVALIRRQINDIYVELGGAS